MKFFLSYKNKENNTGRREIACFFVWGEKKGRNVYNVYSKGGTAAAECLGWRWDLRKKGGGRIWFL